MMRDLVKNLYRKMIRIIEHSTVFGLLMICLLTMHAAVAQSNAYEINCEIKGLESGSLTFLLYISGNFELKTQEAYTDAKSKIKFTGSEKLRPGMYKIAMQGGKTFNLLIENQTRIDVKADIQNLIPSMVVLNDEENKAYYQYLNTVEIHQSKIDTLKSAIRKVITTEDSMQLIKEGNAAINKINELKSAFINNHPFPLLNKMIHLSKEPAMPVEKLEKKMSPSKYLAFYKAHFLDNVDFNDSLTMHLPQFQEKIGAYILSITTQVPDSVWKEAKFLVNSSKKNKEMNDYLVGYLTFCYDGSRINGMDEIFVKMATNYFLKDQVYWKDSYVFDRIQAKVTDALPLLNGNKMPTLILQDKDGDWHSVQDPQGKYTIVVFWDPDCKHCQKEIPILKDYYNRVHASGVDVFAVDIATDKEIWTKFLEDNQLNWTNVADLNRQFNLFKTFDIVSYPQYFLLDKDKNIVAKKIDLESLMRLLDDRLAAK